MKQCHKTLFDYTLLIGTKWTFVPQHFLDFSLIQDKPLDKHSYDVCPVLTEPLPTSSGGQSNCTEYNLPKVY